MLDDQLVGATGSASSLAMSVASPSVITRSGSKVARARRPPIIGMVPMGLARISPSPRKHSATATTHTSARVTRVDGHGVAHAAPPVAAARLAWYSASARSSHAAWNSAHASGVLADAAYAFWNASSRS